MRGLGGKPFVESVPSPYLIFFPFGHARDFAFCASSSLFLKVRIISNWTTIFCFCSRFESDVGVTAPVLMSLHISSESEASNDLCLGPRKGRSWSCVSCASTGVLGVDKYAVLLFLCLSVGAPVWSIA